MATIQEAKAILGEYGAKRLDVLDGLLTRYSMFGFSFDVEKHIQTLMVIAEGTFPIPTNLKDNTEAYRDVINRLEPLTVGTTFEARDHYLLNTAVNQCMTKSGRDVHDLMLGEAVEKLYRTQSEVLIRNKSIDPNRQCANYMKIVEKALKDGLFNKPVAFSSKQATEGDIRRMKRLEALLKSFESVPTFVVKEIGTNRYIALRNGQSTLLIGTYNVVRVDGSNQTLMLSRTVQDSYRIFEKIGSVLWHFYGQKDKAKVQQIADAVFTAFDLRKTVEVDGKKL